MTKPTFSLSDIRALRLLMIVFGLMLGGFAALSRGDIAIVLLAVGLTIATIGISLSVIVWMRRQKTAKAKILN